MEAAASHLLLCRITRLSRHLLRHQPREILGAEEKQILAAEVTIVDKDKRLSQLLCSRRTATLARGKKLKRKKSGEK